ncbi:MAG: hypothetical protein ABWX96_09635 [Propionibacteriaceae bacterium]
MTEQPYPQRPYQAPSRPARPPVSYETRRDAEAAIAARQELGPEYEEDLAAGLAERVEQLAAYRTAELRQSQDSARHHDSYERTAQTQRFVTALVSLGAGIPITGIAVVNGGLIETVVCWAGIVGVNMAQALSNRRKR